MARKSPIQFVISSVGNMSTVLTFAFGAFDIRPIFFLGGTGAVGYGLYLNYSLGTALIFVGLVFMTIGYLMGAKR